MIKNLPGRNPKTKGLQTSPQAPNKMKTLKTKIIFIKRLKKYVKEKKLALRPKVK